MIVIRINRDSTSSRLPSGISKGRYQYIEKREVSYKSLENNKDKMIDNNEITYNKTL